MCEKKVLSQNIASKFAAKFLPIYEFTYIYINFVPI